MKGETYVLYIQFHENLGRDFIYLSRVFNQFGIKLMPISVKDLKSYRLTKKEYVLAVVRDIDSVKEYRGLLKKFLNYAIRSNQVKLFEFSSFENFHDSKMLSAGDIIQKRLPVSMFSMVDLIATEILNDLTVGSRKWPGGRRVKLPTL